MSLMLGAVVMQGVVHLKDSCLRKANKAFVCEHGNTQQKRNSTSPRSLICFCFCCQIVLVCWKPTLEPLSLCRETSSERQGEFIHIMLRNVL